MRGQKVDRSDAGSMGRSSLDMLNFIGRFFKFGMETKQFPSPDKSRNRKLTHYRSLETTPCREVQVASLGAGPNGHCLGRSGATSMNQRRSAAWREGP